MKNILYLLLLVLFASSTVAVEQSPRAKKATVEQSNDNNDAIESNDRAGDKAKAQLRDPAEFHKVVDEYKTYVAKVSPETRKEIITFRKEIAKLNKEKILLYKKLSQASQDYLNKEHQYKKQLPLNRKNLLKLDDSKAKEMKKNKESESNK